MKLVIENDPKEIKKHHKLRQLERSLIELTANLLRVCRGAGKPNDVGVNCAAVIEAFEDFHDVVGRYPSADEVAVPLSFKLSDDGIEYEEELGEKIYALEDIIRGSLQIVASEFLRQRLQVSAGERQLYGGVRALETYREKRWEKAQERIRDERKKKTTPKRWPSKKGD